MTEAEHIRLAEIEREYESMGITSKWVDEYARMSVIYADTATNTPSHNGMYLMLPEGTIPHEVYMEKLTRLIRDMEKAEDSLRIANRSKLLNEECSKDEYISRFGQSAYDQDMSRKAEMRRHQLAKPKEVHYELRTHLTKFKPINSQAFHDKMDALIKEQTRILTNVRIHEASVAAYAGPVPVVSGASVAEYVGPTPAP